jgi:hypothetical protein
MATSTRCEGCGYRFTGETGQRFCSTYCERSAGMAWLYSALQQAVQNPRRPA